MAGAWKTIRVFISSTFRDMHAERDHLIKVTFPALRENLLPYRVELYDIDLRWGITEDEAKNDKVIGLCLEQIDECRPFFLAFLGHRYGWVPESVSHETQKRFPFVRNYPGVSVTELEIRYSLLSLAAGTRVLLLLRDEKSVESIPSTTRQEDFVETDPKLQMKLAKLKQEFVEAQEKLETMQPPLMSGGFSIQPYSPEWDPKRFNRVNDKNGKLAELDDFGKRVEDWLWTAIKQELQLPDAPPEVDPLEAEADLHERFLEMRTRIYVGRDDLYRQMRDFALTRGEIPLLLTGESGLGKSAALARFVRDFRKEHPDVFLLAHFVGASPRTTSLAGMLQRLTQELQRKFQLTLPKTESPDEIIRTFVIAITSLPESTRVVLVLDALNQLDADSRAETLAWLPDKLPPNVRLLCSSATGPQKSPRVLTAFGERKYLDASLRPLSDDERRAIVRAIPKLVAKTLDDEQVSALLANPATRNPLFLMVALEELRGYGSFERLNEMIASLPRDGDSVTKLFDHVFERLELEFSKPVVEWTLRLLACSRRGLSGPELVALTQNLGEQSADVYLVLRQLRAYLQVRDGLFDFYHMSIRRAVEIRYLRWDEEDRQGDPWERWNPRRQPLAAEPTECERQTRERLVEEFSDHWLSPRAIDELPCQLAQLRDWPRLLELLGDLTFFDAAWQTNEVDVRTVWSLMKQVGGLDPMQAFREVLSFPAIHDRDALHRLAQFLQNCGESQSVLPLWTFLGNRVNEARARISMGDLDGAMQLFREQEAIARQREDQVTLAVCLGNQAIICKATGDLDVAVRFLREGEAICRQLNDPDGLQRSLGGQGVILMETGHLDGAMRLYKEQEATCRRLNDPVSLAACLGNQAMIRKATGDLNGALRLHREEEAICRRLDDPAGLQRSLGNQAMVRKVAGDLEGALRLHQEEEAICRRIDDPAGLGASLGNRALILRATGDLSGAMRLLGEQEAICRRLNDPAGLARCRGNQGVILLDIGDFDAALPMLREQEATCRRLNDLDGLQHSLENLAGVSAARRDFDGAMRLLKQQEAICRQLNDADGLQRCLGSQATIRQAAGDTDDALRLLEEQAALRRRFHTEGGEEN
jgi:tetratricopeptide (TPR) repeat protein